MNIDKVLKFFVPKDRSFYPLFEEGINNLVKAAELLKLMLSGNDYDEHEKYHHQIKEIELKGDIITDKAYDQLNKTFITPFDREDIHELVASIDDVIDSINGVSRTICLYKPKRLMPEAEQMAIMVYEAALQLQKMVHYLVDAAANKDEITAACQKVTEIERKADEYYYEAVADLFEKEKDSVELLKNNKIIETLERIIDQEEDVADVVRAILIKMA
ncbi:MAG: DUF47 domain-containing protein [Bacteroidales bacterium]|jgi:predicted phosphate transport protein (TIGR00153 family)|nr:DUF47 domain-containing protein [Bacteroidales bacterium]